MKIAITAIQVILGSIFLFTGFVKLLTKKEELPAKGLIGFENIVPKYIKLLGIAEVSGAIILFIFSIPSLPKFPIQFATSGFAFLLIAASVHHIKRKEIKNAWVAFVLFSCCIIILFFNQKT